MGLDRLGDTLGERVLDKSVTTRAGDKDGLDSSSHMSSRTTSVRGHGDCKKRESASTLTRDDACLWDLGVDSGTRTLWVRVR